MDWSSGLYLQETLEGGKNGPGVTTIPFLLQLASMSPMLLHIMATDIVKACKYCSLQTDTTGKPH